MQESTNPKSGQDTGPMAETASTSGNDNIESKSATDIHIPSVEENTSSANELKSPEIALTIPITADDLSTDKDDENIPHHKISVAEVIKDKDSHLTVPTVRRQHRSNAFICKPRARSMYDESNTTVDDSQASLANSDNLSEAMDSKRKLAINSKRKSMISKQKNERPKSCGDVSKLLLHELWQCANCLKVNEMDQSECWGCELSFGSWAIGEHFCQKCKIKVFTSNQKMRDRTFCPKCNNFLDSNQV